MFSMKMTGILLLVFAIAIAAATFVENDFGTRAARALVYNALWFELLLLLTSINLLGIIISGRLYKKQKRTLFIFHCAFIIILLGAWVTRHIGFEGLMHIRENQSSAELLSDKTYLTIGLDTGGDEIRLQEPVLISTLNQKAIHTTIRDNGNVLEISSRKFIPDARPRAVPSASGKPLVHFVIAGSQGREDLFIFENEMKEVDGITFGYNVIGPVPDIHIVRKDSLYYCKSVFDFRFSGKFEAEEGIIESGSTFPIYQKTLYSFQQMNLVFHDALEQGTLEYVQNTGETKQSFTDAILLDVRYNDQQKEITIPGSKGQKGDNYRVYFSGASVALSYGSIKIPLPFSLKLHDFILTRYAGSNSPSSFASVVEIIDEEKGYSEKETISMNNVLKYKGYRFYQTSYDADEKGTILTVNHDTPGTIITYVGYLLMTLGMILSLANPNSRFRKLGKKSTSVAGILILFLVSTVSFDLHAQSPDSLNKNDLAIDLDHATKFGKLLIQDHDGRIKPVSTLASEVTRKVIRKNEWDGLFPEQVFMGMISNPMHWQHIPMIKISNPSVRKILGIDDKYAAFIDFFPTTANGSQYILHDYVEKAYNTPPAYRDKFDNEMIKVDERVNICYMVYTGMILKMFPLPDSDGKKWYSHTQLGDSIRIMDSIAISRIMSSYLNTLRLTKGNSQSAEDYLELINTYQRRFSAPELIPSDFKVKTEIYYNRHNLFSRLTTFYGLIGFLLLFILFINEFRNRKIKKYISLSFKGLFVLFFVLHSLALAMRWYISGHAPWSNGYEALVFISWSTILAGIIFANRSAYALATTGLLSSVILAVAGMSWMDPEITNLVPVLKSYWLTIHVSVITSSYGFLGLGAMLALINLLLMNLVMRRNVKDIILTLRRTSSIIEQALIIGLYLLTIGTFLGGIWANESWGRYWGWDPKETWALVTVLVYAFIVHTRNIPSLNNVFTFNFLSLIGFSTVIMTYFGVNYYLSGLHSYAKGDPVPVPSFVYYTIIIILIISTIANYKYKKLIGEIKI